MKSIVNNFQLDARRCGNDPDAKIAEALSRRLGVPRSAFRDLTVLNRSVDSRRGDPTLVYKLLIDVDEEHAARFAPATPDELAALEPSAPELPPSTLMHPLVLGTGPAGIFGALELALAGCRPVILERGPEVEKRCADHEKFLRTRELDEESNLLIGEGGAGTFSDGKLYTGTRDVRGRFALHALVEAGAPPEILNHSRPHVGSDNLRRTCAALRKRIVDLGGEFRFGANVREMLTRDGRFVGVKLASGETVEAPALLFAPGLGGAGLLRELAARFGGTEPKPFQIGCRIEHPQQFVDIRQYRGSRPECLGAAEYHIAAGGVSSFCMCPGGTLVNASSRRGRSCTNGMSEHARDGEFANAALIVTLRPEEFGTPDEPFELIDKLERDIFLRGGSDYTFPAQDAAAFLNGNDRLSRREGSAETGYVRSRIDDLLPEKVRTALSKALVEFDRRMPGFIRHGVFVGSEPCVSSPLRLVRSENGEWRALPGVYPAGEGVGAAGGIVSAACDGMRAAEAMLKAFPAKKT
ncbi:MAG: hypothetical protein J6Y54_01945 [Lentisphaeria bacterium]|nr:hypothetical protein [Lentisphaeria bacterium]